MRNALFAALALMSAARVPSRLIGADVRWAGERQDCFLPQIRADVALMDTDKSR
jgi:hypothetical protein